MRQKSLDLPVQEPSLSESGKVKSALVNVCVCVRVCCGLYRFQLNAGEGEVCVCVFVRVFTYLTDQLV